MTDPTDDELWTCALSHYRAGRFPECESACLGIAPASPRFPSALHLLGMSLLRQNRLTDAIAALGQSAAFDPAAIESRLTLAGCLISAGRPEEAVAVYQQVLRFNPNHAESLNNLGGLHIELLQLDEARDVLQRLIALYPDSPEAHNNLGSLHLTSGRLDLACRNHRRAIELKPSFSLAHSNLLHDLLYSGLIRPEQVFQEHLRWAQQHAPAGKPAVAAARSLDPDRPIRIAYVSPDLRNHPVAAFLEPILAHHDRDQYAAICYQDNPLTDAVTARLKPLASAWRQTFALSDDDLSRQIRADQIDILIDLSVHSGRNRLPLFAQKPAPILMTYLGYAFSTGLASIDYRISDHTVDPPGLTESIHTEKLLRLPDVLWCFRPPSSSPPVSPLPALTNGYITFGSANRLAKITASMLRRWSAILHATPNSRLILIAPELRAASVRCEILHRLIRVNIDPARVSLHGSLPLNDYLVALANFDIALDTFPFTGGSTTCHTLWMGVPLITLAGRTPISRVSASILTAIGQADLIANTPDAFVSIATGLAADVSALSRRRQQMRIQMRFSPLMNEAQFARNLEAAYRNAWRAAFAGKPI